MRRRFVSAVVFLIAAAFALAACAKPLTRASESCGITDDGGTYDTTGRPDGIYEVRDDRLASTPLTSFDRIVRTGDGIDPKTGKRWIRLRLASPEASALRDFTATAIDSKKIAVLASGEIASIHRVRQPLTSADVQVSCCNPRACDRWDAILARSPDHRE